MGESCPVCDQAVPTGASRCPTCGFPTALVSPELGPLLARGDPGEPANGSAARPADSVSTPLPPPSPEAELTAIIGRSLAGRMELLQPLARDAPDVTSELCEAALSEAVGHTSEALAILRSAQGRLERESRRTIEKAVTRLDERRRTLERSGLRVDVPELPPSAAAIDRENPEDLLPRLLEVDARLSRFESDWKGVQGLLEQIDSLQTAAESLEIGLGDIPDRVAAVRQTLASEGVTEEGLDRIVLEAARVLMDLHEAVPDALGEELRRQNAAFAQFPDGHPGVDSARRAHGLASQHLKEGRLPEAIRGVGEVRSMIHALGLPPPQEVEPRVQIPAPPPAVAVAPPEVVVPATVRVTPPPAPIPPSAAPARPAATPRPLTPEEEALLANLTMKARSLAGRVRSLPADSPQAIDAAARIREATELLRARRLPEADIALTRLMRSLAYREPSP